MSTTDNSIDTTCITTTTTSSPIPTPNSTCDAILKAASAIPEQPFYLSVLTPTPTTNTNDDNNLFINEYPSIQEFNQVIQNYLENLSSKKRDKALIDNHRYSLILQVLKDPKNTTISTAQFRFWVKKMFQLVVVVVASSGPDNSRMQQEYACHDNKPVAMREEIYNILIVAHKEAHHGGRDKTSALVRERKRDLERAQIQIVVKLGTQKIFLDSKRINCSFCSYLSILYFKKKW